MDREEKNRIELERGLKAVDLLKQQHYGVEFEEVTIKVPKRVMEFIRKVEGDPVAWIEYNVVDMVRAEMEGMEPQEWISRFNLDAVFYVVLEDQRYAPAQTA